MRQVLSAIVLSGQAPWAPHPDHKSRAPRRRELKRMKSPGFAGHNNPRR